MDSYDLFGMNRRLVRFGLGILVDELGVDGNSRIFVYVGFDSGFGCFDDGFDKRIVVFLKDKRERNGQAADADIVFEHAGID